MLGPMTVQLSTSGFNDVNTNLRTPAAPVGDPAVGRAPYTDGALPAELFQDEKGLMDMFGKLEEKNKD